MEILNNIWTLLTTESEAMTEILLTPFTFLETYIGMVLFLTILNFKSEKKNKILYVIISSLITTININVVPGPFNVFISYISNFILIVLIFRLKPFQALISVVAPIVIFGIVATLIF